MNNEKLKEEIKELVKGFVNQFKNGATERELKFIENAFGMGIIQGMEVATKRGISKIEFKELAGVETKMNSISSGDLYYIAWNQDKQEEALESIGKLVRKLNKIIKKEKELNK